MTVGARSDSHGNRFARVDLPATAAPLFRYLDKEEYAERFLAGEIRLSSLAKFRSDENESRRDEGEGHLQYQQEGSELPRGLGEVFVGDGAKNILFARNHFSARIDAPALSVSSHLNPQLAERWSSPFVVEIGKPRLFAVRTGDALIAQHGAESVRVILRSIRYRDDHTRIRHDIEESAFQKHSRFAVEREWRYLFAATPHVPGHTVHLKIQPEALEMRLHRL